MEYTRTRSFDAQVAFGVKFSKGEWRTFHIENIAGNICGKLYSVGVWVTSLYMQQL